jgi:HD-like signal output (HDOD) protein
MEHDAPIDPTIQHAQIRKDAQILKVAASLGFLHAGADSAPRLMAILCAPQVSEREIAALIKQQPAIYARVLRVANSPYYGQTRVISSIERALPVLGLDGIRGIAAAACLSQTVNSRVLGSPLDMKAWLEHSLATAAAAESLARIHHGLLSSEAFIAGLLHNLGVVVQVQLDTPGVEAIIRARQAGDTRDIRALEAQYAAVGHEECVAVILEAWHLPDALVAAVRHHHDPAAAPAAYSLLAALVNLGANLSLASGYTYALEPAPAQYSAQVLAQLGLSVQDIEAVSAELPGRAARLRSALGSA